MPVEFLTKEQEESYGRYPDELSLEQLAKYFLIDDQDKIFIFRRRGEHNHLGIALQLCTVRFLGTFLSNPTDVPANVIQYVSNQLKIDKNKLIKYRTSETRWDHTCEICYTYGYYKFTEHPHHWRLTRWLYTRAWLGTERPIVLFDLATNRCVEQKILLPGVTVLAKLIAQVYERSSTRLWKKLSVLPDATQSQKLHELLNVNTRSKQTGLDNLRRPPTVVSPNGIVQALERLNLMRSLGSCDWNICRIPMGKIRKLSKYAAVARTQMISRMPDNKRLAHLVAFAIDFTATAQDDVINVFDKYLSELFKRTNRRGDKNKLQTSKSLSSSMRKILTAFEILLDETTSDEKIRESIFSKVSKDELTKAFNKMNSLTGTLESTISFHELFQNYSNARKFLPALLEMIKFKAVSSAEPVLEAWEFLKKEEKRKQKKFYKNAPTTGIAANWEKVTVIDNAKVYACGYTFWVLDRMHQAIKSREVFISGSEQYDDGVLYTYRPKVQ